MEKNEEKIVHKYEGYINVEEYKKMVKYFPKRTYLSLIRMVLACNTIIFFILLSGSKNFWSSISIFLFLQILGMVYCKIRLEHIAGKTFLKRNGSDMNNKELNVEFYNDYLIGIWPDFSLKIYYKEIERIVETETNVYLENGKNNFVIILLKEKLDKGLIEFLKEKVEKNVSKRTKLENPYKIPNRLIILFLITLISLPMASIIHDVLNNSINPIFARYKDKWIYLLFMIIPILSIIFGFEYKERGYKCTKNIVGGFIILFLLFINFAEAPFSTFTQDYNKINNYKDMLNIEVPEKGMLQIYSGAWGKENWDNYQQVCVYYDKNVNLESSLKKSSTWKLSTKMDSELKELIPRSMIQNEGSYISIYNGTTKEYNKLPNEKGVYQMYVMEYDLATKTLEIHQYDYNYNNN